MASPPKEGSELKSTIIEPDQKKARSEDKHDTADPSGKYASAKVPPPPTSLLEAAVEQPQIPDPNSYPPSVATTQQDREEATKLRQEAAAGGAPAEAGRTKEDVDEDDMDDNGWCEDLEERTRRIAREVVQREV